MAKGIEGQESLFPDLKTTTEQEWEGMPEFVQGDKDPIKQVIVSFKSWDDYKAFAKLVDQNLSPKTQSIWYPKAEIERMVDKAYVRKEDYEIGDEFYYDRHGEKALAVFKYWDGEEVVAILKGDHKNEGVEVRIHKDLLI